MDEPFHNLFIFLPDLQLQSLIFNRILYFSIEHSQGYAIRAHLTSFYTFSVSIQTYMFVIFIFVYIITTIAYNHSLLGLQVSRR